MGPCPANVVSAELPAEDVTKLLTDLVCGAPRAAGVATVDPYGLTTLADAHGLLPLLAWRLDGCAEVPAALAEALHLAARRALVDELVQGEALRRVLEAMSARGLRPVLMKGAQLAYSAYARPDLRPRVDSDLLITLAERGATAATLADLGYQELAQVPGELVSYQRSYALSRNGGTRHVVDVHWRIANPQRFGAVVPPDRVLKDAVPVPALGPAARGLSPWHALVVACVHPVAHHANQPYLIWQYDVHHIASDFKAADWERFVSAAVTGAVAGICRASLAASVRTFGTTVPDAVWSALEDSAATPDDVDRSVYLDGDLRHIERVWWDMQTLPTWRERVRLLRQHVFPPARYMRQVYAPSSVAPLTWLYARRVWSGAHKWLGRP